MEMFNKVADNNQHVVDLNTSKSVVSVSFRWTNHRITPFYSFFGSHKKKITIEKDFRLVDGLKNQLRIDTWNAF